MNESLKILTVKLSGAMTQLPYIPQALALVWSAARPWTIAWAVLLIAQGLLPVALVHLTQNVVDSMVAAMNAGGQWQALEPALRWVIVMALVLLLIEGLESVMAWIRATQSELVSDHVSGLIHDKAVSLDMAFYETPDYYDRLYRARIDAISRPVALLENVGSLAQNGITLIAMAGVLMRFGWWVPLLLIVSTLPAFHVVLQSAMHRHQWRVRNTTDQRRTRYYDYMLTSQETAAELRLFALGDHFKTAFQSLRQRLRGESAQLARREAMARFAAGGMAIVAICGAMGWMVWQAARGLVTLGNVALFYQAFNQGQRVMRTLLGQAGDTYSNILFLENLFEFLGLQSQVTDPIAPAATPAALREGIRFEQVTFRYPGSQQPALADFNLSVDAGQIAAIVGANGAGKSTLIKLLCRFYDPEAGRVTIDGTDIRQWPLIELRRLITVLFQEPVHYHTTAAENIAIGDLAAAPNMSQIEAAAAAAGADAPIRRLPDGYQTVLGKWFGGAELSVGEWQRVALARAFIRQAPIIILDEPTSAMDSWAEADWLARFRQLAAGHTAIVITHRFTTAMQADVIHVMDNGRIIESGSHEQLLAQGGRYAESVQAQFQGRFNLNPLNRA
ncbi:MAG: ABC transporter ATP-binding protein [Acidobacteriota bacterium]|nr:ABC transporter ATP-binding protein/permease [Blastocatellia bacterium]MDW8238504.1 ABC transporter ATP-binding protein [Acidobacteriota bacterium]